MMSKDWRGLRFWNESRHSNLSIKFWKENNLSELNALLMHDMKQTYSTRASGVMQYTDNYEREKSEEAVRNGYTNYKEDSFEYFINDCGFRGNWNIGTEQKSIGFFGCSFTFGVGLPEQDVYTTLFSNHLGCKPYNFGVPGGSMNRATRYYSLVSKYQKFDYVVFLVPHIGRLELPRFDEYDNVGYVMNVMPNWQNADKNEEQYRMRLYSALDDSYFEFDTIRNVNHCVNIAEANNTKIFFSSWDMPTYDLIYDYLGKDSGMILPWFEVLEFQRHTKTNLARDGEHPGPVSHSMFLERSIPYLK